MPIIAGAHIAYLAGFFDGEGCITHNSNRIRIHVTNTDIRPLIGFENMFGGVIGLERGTNQPVFRWRLDTRIKIQDCLRSLFKYLLVKREEVEIALSILEKFPSRFKYDNDSLQERNSEIQRLTDIKHNKLAILKGGK